MKINGLSFSDCDALSELSVSIKILAWSSISVTLLEKAVVES